MVDIQSARRLSPRGTDTLLWDDIESKRRSGNSSNSTTTAFDSFTRRFTTFSSTTYSHDNKVVQCINADDAMRQIKLKIIKYNPSIFHMLREHLIARRCYTTATVSCTLNQFIDVELRIPELRYEIKNHQLSYTNHQNNKNSSMFFAYLTGESLSPSSSITPNKRNTPTSLTRSVTSSSSYSDSSASQCSQELSLPSLQSFG